MLHSNTATSYTAYQPRFFLKFVLHVFKEIVNSLATINPLRQILFYHTNVILYLNFILTQVFYYLWEKNILLNTGIYRNRYRNQYRIYFYSSHIRTEYS